MAGINRVMMIGSLGRKPELRQTKAGKPVANFSIAINEKKDAPPLWVNIVCFDKTAENVAQYLDKGRSVYIDGRLSMREYEKDGVKRQAWEVIANQVLFLGDNKGGGKREEAPADDDGGLFE